MKPPQRRRETTIRLSSLVAVAALAAGGLSSGIIGVNAAGAATSHKAKSIVISTSENSQFGTILVSGTPVYTLRASKTPCTAQCLKIWPEVLLPKGVKKAKAGTGVKAAKLGTVKRAHGALQVTYAGKPLYWFYEDVAGGQVNGNITDSWGTWSVIVTALLSSTSPPPGSPTPAVAPTSPAPTTTPSHTTSPPPTTTPSHPTSPPPTTPPTSPPTTTTTTPGTGGVGF